MDSLHVPQVTVEEAGTMLRLFAKMKLFTEECHSYQLDNDAESIKALVSHILAHIDDIDQQVSFQNRRTAFKVLAAAGQKWGDAYQPVVIACRDKVRGMEEEMAEKYHNHVEECVKLVQKLNLGIAAEKAIRASHCSVFRDTEKVLTMQLSFFPTADLQLTLERLLKRKEPFFAVAVSEDYMDAWRALLTHVFGLRLHKTYVVDGKLQYLFYVYGDASRMQNGSEQYRPIGVNVVNIVVSKDWQIMLARPNPENLASHTLNQKAPWAFPSALLSGAVEPQAFAMLVTESMLGTRKEDLHYSNEGPILLDAYLTPKFNAHSEEMVHLIYLHPLVETVSRLTECFDRTRGKVARQCAFFDAGALNKLEEGKHHLNRETERWLQQREAKNTLWHTISQLSFKRMGEGVAELEEMVDSSVVTQILGDDPVQVTPLNKVEEEEEEPEEEQEKEEEETKEEEDK